MADARATSSGGIGLCGLLTVVFVCAKVFGFEPVASWSWVWVLSPLWIGLGITLGILALIAVGVAIYAMITHYTDKRRRYKFRQAHFPRGIRK